MSGIATKNDLNNLSNNITGSLENVQSNIVSSLHNVEMNLLSNTSNTSNTSKLKLPLKFGVQSNLIKRLLVDNNVENDDNTYHPYSMNTTVQAQTTPHIYATLYSYDCNLKLRFSLAESVFEEEKMLTIILSPNTYEVIKKPNSSDPLVKGKLINAKYIQRVFSKIKNNNSEIYFSYWKDQIINMIKNFETENSGIILYNDDELKFSIEINDGFFINDLKDLLANVYIMDVEGDNWRYTFTNNWYLEENTLDKTVFKTNPYSFITNTYDTVEFININNSNDNVYKSNKETGRIFIDMVMSGKILGSSSCGTTIPGRDRYKTDMITKTLKTTWWWLNPRTATPETDTQRIRLAANILRYLTCVALTEKQVENIGDEFGRLLSNTIYIPNENGGLVENWNLENNTNKTALDYITKDQFEQAVQDYLKLSQEITVGAYNPSSTNRTYLRNILNYCNKYMEEKYNIKNLIVPIDLNDDNFDDVKLSDFRLGGWALDNFTVGNIATGYTYHGNPDNLPGALENKESVFYKVANDLEKNIGTVSDFVDSFFNDSSIVPFVIINQNAVQLPIINDGQPCSCVTCPLEQLITADYYLSKEY